MTQVTQEEAAARRNKLKKSKPRVYEKVLKFEEKLARGESIAIIQFQYDYKCNFRCEHCSVKRFQGRRNAKRFTIERVRDLYDQADALGFARTTITGGEPTTFKDFDQLVEAIGPERFYINSDSNGWLLTPELARHMKEIGVDRIQLSIDSLNAEEHDRFRRMPGAFARAMRSIDYVRDAGLDIFIQTVVTKQRLHSNEFIRFLKHFNAMGIGVFVTYAKPVGAWEGHYECLVDKEDMRYMRELEKTYQVFTHLTPAYGIEMGCIAVKGMFSVTQYGDVMPCPYVHVSLGNVFLEPLKDIIERGMRLKPFKANTCLIAEDRAFIEKYIAGRVYGKPLPVPYEEVFLPEDFEPR